MKEDKAKQHMGKGKSGSKSKSKHRVHKMHIRHAANGGHIVEHEYRPEEDENGGMSAPENEEHVLPASPDNQMLAQHVAEHMAPPEEPPAPAAGGPPVPAPPPMGA